MGFRACELVLCMLFMSLACSSTTTASVEIGVDCAGRQVDSLMAQWVDPDTPGAAVAVIRDGDVIFKKGYGLANLEYGVPITPTTVFDVGSLAKQFTAFAIALLDASGDLSLDDDVRKYVPEAPDFGEPITIRHLVHHLSGLRESYDLLRIAGWGYEDIILSEHTLKLISNQKELNFSPGDQWLYCNTGYTLLAAVVARVTGEEFATWTRRHIFEPLNMLNTRFVDDCRILVENRAYSYMPAEEGFKKEILNSADPGCTNLLTTVEDMAKWVLNFENPTVGGSEAFQQVHQCGVLNNGEKTGYAFGQFIGECKQHRAAYHSGKTAGFRSYLIRFLDKGLAVVVTSNVGYFDVTSVARGIADIYLDDQPNEIEQAPQSVEMMPDTGMPTTAELDPAILKSYEGLYRLESGRLLAVEEQNGRLLLHNLSDVPLELSPVGQSTFVPDGVNAEISFECDEQGNIRQLSLHFGTAVVPAVRTQKVHLRADELNRYCGSYYSGELETIYTIVMRDGRLLATHGRHPDTGLTPLSKNHFSADDPWFRDVRFDFDETGRAIGLWVSALGVKNLRFENLTRK